jgi:hypothetical protein
MVDLNTKGFRMLTKIEVGNTPSSSFRYLKADLLNVGANLLSSGIL